VPASYQQNIPEYHRESTYKNDKAAECNNGPEGIQIRLKSKKDKRVLTTQGQNTEVLPGRHKIPAVDQPRFDSPSQV